MLFGDPSEFALEHSITQVYRPESQFALGYFLIMVQGTEFGVRAPDATLMACSYDEVCRRLASRGLHLWPELTEEPAESIALSFARTCRDPDFGEKLQFRGESLAEFCSKLFACKIVWAPDGDEAFDDGSYVFHFDLPDAVRLIAFKLLDSEDETLASVRELRMDADRFYSTLRSWRDGIRGEWETRIRSLAAE